MRHFGHDVGLLLEVEGDRLAVVSRVSDQDRVDESADSPRPDETVPLAEMPVAAALTSPEPLCLSHGGGAIEIADCAVDPKDGARGPWRTAFRSGRTAFCWSFCRLEPGGSPVPRPTAN